MITNDVLEGPCLIMPEHINTEEHFWDAFKRMQMGSAANTVVRLCQQRRSWVAFSLEEYDAACSSAQSWYRLDDLLADDWLRLGVDGKLRVTIGFIARCWGAAPKVAVPVSA